MAITIIPKHHHITLLMVYLLCNGLMLINDGVFWDDWTLFNMSWEGLNQQFSGNGFFLGSYLHYFLNSLPNPPVIYHALVAIFQIGTVFLVWGIFKELRLNSSFFLWVTVFMTATPYFSAKIMMICFPYVLGTFLFYLAYWLTLVYLEKGLIWLRGLSIVCFFVSFMINSLLVFYVIVLITLIFKADVIRYSGSQNRSQKLSLHNAWRLFYFSDYIFLPLVFWLFREKFMQPSGLYAESGYNALSISSAGEFLEIGLDASLCKLFLTLFDTIVSNNLILLYVGFSVFLIVCTKLKYDKSQFSSKLDSYSVKTYFLIIAIGFLLVVLAIFPYAAVKKVPVFDFYYDTRHQLLMPLGASIILVAACYLTPFKRGRHTLLILILGSFFTFNIHVNLQYLGRRFKQEAIMDYFALQDFRRETVIYEDRTKHYDDLEDFRFYELAGMSKYANQIESNLFVEEATFNTYEWEAFIKRGVGYNLTDYKLSDPTKKLTIESGGKELSDYVIFQLTFLRYCCNQKYKKELNFYFDFSITEL